MRTKHVFFVNCAYPFFQANFRKTKNSEVLVFDDVRKRLASREVSREAPSDEIVRFYLAKRVSQFMQSTRTDFLYYYLRDAREDTVSRVQTFASANSAASVFLMVEDAGVYDALRLRMDNVLLVRESMS